MAPLPQATSSPTSSQPQQQAQTALPGMKRGIAIGVAACVCIILIALVTFFAVRRRSKVKAQRLRARASCLKDEKEWVEEKKELPVQDENWPQTSPPPVEADTWTIYEMDASPIPELPTKCNERDAQELDADGAQYDSESGDRSTVGLQRRVESAPNDEIAGCHAPRRQVPILHISPPEVSPLGSGLLLGASPLGVSPLEEVYFPQTPRSPRGWV